MIPQVSSDTVQIMVQYVPIPIKGTVFVGPGKVWEILTHSIPMTNANHHLTFIQFSSLQGIGPVLCIALLTLVLFQNNLTTYSILPITLC